MNIGLPNIHLDTTTVEAIIASGVIFIAGVVFLLLRRLSKDVDPLVQGVVSLCVGGLIVGMIHVVCTTMIII